MLNSKKVPRRDPPMPFMKTLWNSRRLILVSLLIACVIGTIYGGVATPTEAGTFGVIGAMILTKFTGGLSLKTLGESLMSAMKISCMIPFIVACAAVPSIAVGFLNIAQLLASTVQAMNLSPAMLLVVLALFFLMLGCFLEGISILVLSSAVVLPMVQAAGIDLVWFGIYIITVRAGLQAFVQRTDANEFMAVSDMFDPVARRRFYEIIAEQARGPSEAWPRWCVAAPAGFQSGAGRKAKERPGARAAWRRTPRRVPGVT